MRGLPVAVMQRRKKIFSPTFRDYFIFSRRERRGLLILSFLLLIQCIVLWYLHHWPVAPGSLNQNALSETVSYDSTIISSELETAKGLSVTGTAKPDRLFPFNPNSAGKAEWMELGLSERQAMTIVKYVSRGGRFRVRKDVKKMYVLSEPEYSRLEPYILLPDSIIHKPVFEKSGHPRTWIDLAFADTLELDRLPGIGYGFANRIIRYRERLGGFVSIQQVREVWGMTDSLFERFQPFVFLSDSTPFQKTDINASTFGVLSKHPYIGYRLARILVNYREQHGAFKDVDAIRNVPLVTDEIFRKLAPYIVVSDSSLH